MTPTSVPQDIIETIIDELRDDLRTLTTCALVSHTFRPQSQKHIFSRITLLIYRNRRIQQINDILSIHPELALYVRHLRISLGRTPDHTLARTVRMLTQIRSLHFGWLGSSVGWEKYPVDVKSAILDLFYLPRSREDIYFEIQTLSLHIRSRKQLSTEDVGTIRCIPTSGRH
jgi:hypothetical protein